MDKPLGKPLIAAVAVVSLALFAASLAKVLSPAKGTPATKVQTTDTTDGGTSVIPKTIRVVNIYPKMPDKLPPIVPMPALPVTPVTPAVVATAALVDPEPAVPQVEPRRHYRHLADAGDICARHHLHKVFTNGGRSWRCRHA